MGNGRDLFERYFTDEMLQIKFRSCTMCPFGYKFCLREIEHIDHLFLHCSFVSKARNFVSYTLGTVNCLPLAGHAPSNYAIFVGLKLIAFIQVHILCLCVSLFVLVIYN